MKTSPELFLKALAVAGVLCMCGSAVAQAPNTSTPAGSQLPLATLELIVTDKSNHSLDNVDANELQVFEDGKLQKLISIAREERPVVYTITIDNTGSFKDLLGNALDAAKLLISRNKEADETQLVRFVDSKRIETVGKFTAERSELLDNLNSSFYLELGQTAVIDAVYLSVKAAADYEVHRANARRAVVLISDGEDRASYYTADALVKLLREKDVQVFVIGIVAKLSKEGGFVRPSPREAAEKLLNRIAQESGGRVFFPKNVTELTEAIDEIAHDLRTQFVVAYQRLGSAPRKGFQKVQIKILETPAGKKLTAITRPGYLVNPPK